MELSSNTQVIGSIEYDKCILCGRVSPYPISLDIYQRIGYIEGAGQGCFSPPECITIEMQKKIRNNKIDEIINS
jgi:hypothetical protein